MKIDQKIEFFTAEDLLEQAEIDELEIIEALKALSKKEDFDPLVFRQLVNYDLYYCQRHNIFHEYYYETDDGNIYTASDHHPVCPLCLLDIDIDAD